MVGATGATLDDQGVAFTDPAVDRVDRRAGVLAIVDIAGLRNRAEAVEAEGVFLCRDRDRSHDERVTRVCLRQRGDRIPPLVRAEAKGGIVRHGRAIRPGLRLQVERRVGERVVVEGPDHELAVAAVDDSGRDLGGRIRGCVGVNVDDGAGVDQVAGLRVVVGRSLRFDDELADEAVAPVVDAVDVVVPEDVVEGDVRVPALLHELHAGVLTGQVVADERRVDGQCACHGVDAGDLVYLDRVEALADGDERAIVELGDAREVQGRRSGVRRVDELRVLGLVGTNRHLVRVAGDHPVGGLRVELDVVDVEVDLVEVRNRSVLQVARQGHRGAVADVRPDREWLLRFGSIQDRLFLLRQDEDPSDRVGLRLGHLDRRLERNDVELADRRRGRAEAIGSVRPWVDRTGWGFVRGLAEPRRAAMPVR